MRHLLIQMQPRGIEDVVCALALIRPGAGAVGMKGRYIRRHRGGEPVPTLPAGLAAVLGETYGLLVYQDDALGVILRPDGPVGPRVAPLLQAAPPRRTARRSRTACWRRSSAGCALAVESPRKPSPSSGCC